MSFPFHNTIDENKTVIISVLKLQNWNIFKYVIFALWIILHLGVFTLNKILQISIMIWFV